MVAIFKESGNRMSLEICTPLQRGWGWRPLFGDDIDNQLLVQQKELPSQLGGESSFSMSRSNILKTRAE